LQWIVTKRLPRIYGEPAQAAPVAAAAPATARQLPKVHWLDDMRKQ
jgi:hypothetical protein